MFYPSWIEVAIAAGIPSVTAAFHAVRNTHNGRSALAAGAKSTLWSAVVVSVVFLVIMLSLDIARDSADLQHGDKYVVTPILVGLSICVFGIGPAIASYAIVSWTYSEPDDLQRTRLETGNPSQPPNNNC